MNNYNKSIALCPGSEEGVGPELLIKAISKLDHQTKIKFYWCSDQDSLKLACDRAGIFLKNIKHHEIICFDQVSHKSKPAWALIKSVELAKNNLVQAIITGPIEKSVLSLLDHQTYPGQTEYFADKLGKPNIKPFMSFMGGPFILSLLTTHCSVKNISSKLNINYLVNNIINITHECGLVLRKDISKLKISLLGLNPHAGEGGLIGQEELEIYLPAIKILASKNIKITGPLPADGLFSYWHKLTPAQIPDIIIASYHDQGLIPYKLLSQGRSTNVTLGLQVPRTSPSHGTAPELVGTNQACEQSTLMAIKTALKLASL